MPQTAQQKYEKVIEQLERSVKASGQRVRVAQGELDRLKASPPKGSQKILGIRLTPEQIMASAEQALQRALTNHKANKERVQRELQIVQQRVARLSFIRG